MSEFQEVDANPHLTTLIEEKKDSLWISLEYFPPKTEAGVENLYKLNEKLKAFSPLFVDVTWGAGGSTSQLTLELCKQMKLKFGSVVNMHLTCTNMESEKVTEALEGCKAAGIRNIIALRGDPPLGQAKWEAVEGGFTCALDLVKFIKSVYGDYFNVSVSGYPEGHPDKMTVVEDESTLTPSEAARCATFKDAEGKDVVTVCKDADFELEMKYLKEKVDAGASCIITQMFFDVQVFVNFVKKCREEYNIQVPILPGIMCIASKGGFERMTRFCKVRVPPSLFDEVAAVEDDAACKQLGIRVGTQMCRELIEAGTVGLHFYTLNMGQVTTGIIENLQAANLLLTVLSS